MATRNTHEYNSPTSTPRQRFCIIEYPTTSTEVGSSSPKVQIGRLEMRTGQINQCHIVLMLSEHPSTSMAHDSISNQNNRQNHKKVLCQQTCYKFVNAFKYCQKPGCMYTCILQEDIICSYLSTNGKTHGDMFDDLVYSGRR